MCASVRCQVDPLQRQINMTGISDAGWRMMIIFHFIVDSSLRWHPPPIKQNILKQWDLMKAFAVVHSTMLSWLLLVLVPLGLFNNRPLAESRLSFSSLAQRSKFTKTIHSKVHKFHIRFLYLDPLSRPHPHLMPFLSKNVLLSWKRFQTTSEGNRWPTALNNVDSIPIQSRCMLSWLRKRENSIRMHVFVYESLFVFLVSPHWS